VHLHAYPIKFVIDDRRKACLVERSIRARRAGSQHGLDAHPNLKPHRLERLQTTAQEDRRCGRRGRHEHGGSAYIDNGDLEGSG
jgi:hypothetical protein